MLKPQLIHINFVIGKIMIINKNVSNIFRGDATEFTQGAAQVCHCAQFGDYHTILPKGEKKKKRL